MGKLQYDFFEIMKFREFSENIQHTDVVFLFFNSISDSHGTRIHFFEIFLMNSECIPVPGP